MLLRWFGIWALAFYATAMAYVFEGRGQSLAALATAALALGCILSMIRAATHGHPDSRS